CLSPDAAPPAIPPLSLHDALPISGSSCSKSAACSPCDAPLPAHRSSRSLAVAEGRGAGQTCLPGPSATKGGFGPQRAGGQQAEGPGAGDGLGSVVRAELGVQVADVGPDGVVRDVQLAADLLRR